MTILVEVLHLDMWTSWEFPDVLLAAIS